MNYILREYQQKAVQAGIDFFLDRKENKPSVIVAPTGSGKSLIIANIAKKLDGKVIIFQPSKELLEQNFAKYVSYGEFAEIYSASAGRKKVAPVTFATIGSVVNKPELFKEFSYCIIDECHNVSPDENTMYNTFLNSLSLKVLGLTATPVRMKRYNFPEPHAKVCMLDRMRPKYFSKYLYIIQISEMVKNGYFCKLEYIEKQFDGTLLKLNSTGADYTEKSLHEAYVANNTNGYIIEISKNNSIKHILCFVVSVADAYGLSKLIPNSAVIEGTMNKTDRSDILRKFKSGIIKIVINVGVLTTGFDFPELDCIILARPTQSLALYYQMVGRGVRPFVTKEKCIIFDISGNIKRFGQVENFDIIEIGGKMNIVSNGKILTNVDITDVRPKEIEVKNCPIFTFGKFKDKKVIEADKWYIKWFFQNVTRNKYNEDIFKFIELNELVA